MATYTWSIPAGKEITGSTYLKDTDNYLGDTISDLVDFVNGEGLHENKGMTYDFVDKSSDQTITGVKTFTQDIVGNITGNVIGNITGDVIGNITGDVDGNSSTATELQTAIEINGVSFNGTTNITILDDTKLSISTGTTDLTSTATPVDADEFVIADSTSSFSLKKLSFTNLKATLLTYFDTLYSRTSAVFGVGQTWKNVTASRSSGVTYTNNTGKPIEVSIYISGSSQTNLTTDGSLLITTVPSGTVAGMHTAVIPNNYTYRLSGGTPIYWSELR